MRVRVGGDDMNNCDDAISREKAIMMVCTAFNTTTSNPSEEVRKILHKCKEKLKKIESVQPSREAYKDCDNCKKCDESFMKGHNIGLENGYKQGVNDASVSRKGHWLHKEVTDDYRVTGQCSECKERKIIDNFCPNCGADMRGDT